MSFISIYCDVILFTHIVVKLCFNRLLTLLMNFKSYGKFSSSSTSSLRKSEISLSPHGFSSILTSTIKIELINSFMIERVKFFSYNSYSSISESALDFSRSLRNDSRDKFVDLNSQNALRIPVAKVCFLDSSARFFFCWISC